MDRFLWSLAAGIGFSIIGVVVQSSIGDQPNLILWAGIGLLLVVSGTIGKPIWNRIRKPVRITTATDKLADFIIEGQQLRKRLNEEPLPVEEHNAWIERMEEYCREHLGKSFAVRLSDFSGLIFYGNNSKLSQMKMSIDGRLRRLHELISEVNRGQGDTDKRES